MLIGIRLFIFDLQVTPFVRYISCFIQQTFSPFHFFHVHIFLHLLAELDFPACVVPGIVVNGQL